MNTLLVELLEEFHQKMKRFSVGVKRQAKLPEVPNKIIVAIGMRRTGKTYFLLQKIHALLKKVPLSRILYLNFEDDRFYPFTQQKLRDLLEGFYELYPENHQKLCYFFLDEIQNVENWHIVIRRFFDSKNVKIYLTGSSAKLLSKEIGTSLRGRSLSTEIWPFSFQEFLCTQSFSNLTPPLGKNTPDKLSIFLKNYLIHGGFPETINLSVENSRALLQDYVSVVIFRDIIERYKITNITLVKYIIKMLLKNVGCSFSVHKFYNDLKSQGLGVSKTTIHEYLSHIEDAYLAFTVPLYSESLRKTHSNPRKIYAVDTGLVNAYNLGFAHNIGHYFENLIYLDLRRARHQIYYYLTESRQEVDFLSQDPLGNWHLWQVCWNMEDAETLKRETSALQEAEKELKLTGGTIITPATYFSSFLPQVIMNKKDIL